MTMDVALEAISAVGFPIVAFLLMFYHSTKVVRENTKVLSELVELLKGRK